MSKSLHASARRQREGRSTNAMIGSRSDLASTSVSRALGLLGQRCCLSVLDIRYEPDQRIEDERHDDNLLVKELLSLGFEEKVKGFFRRPAVWNPDIARRLVTQGCIN
jgi:hypothetical protein